MNSSEEERTNQKIFFYTPETGLGGMEFGKLLRNFLKSPKYTLNRGNSLHGDPALAEKGKEHE